MKLRALTLDELDHALVLLNEGFGSLQPDGWETCLRNIFSHAESLGFNTIGHIASNKEGDIGICLAIPSLRTVFETQPQKVINLAAFYLKQKYEWMAGMFLRRIMSDPETEYTDLTPTASMQKVNQLLGFSTYAVGTLVVPLPVSAMRLFSETKIHAYSSQTNIDIPDKIAQILNNHAGLGCICLIIEHNGAYYPAVFKIKKRSGMPSVRVILMKDRALLKKSLGSLSRYLLKQGFLFLEFEVQQKTEIAEGFLRAGTSCVQSTRKLPCTAIDHSFSELVFVK